MSQRSKLLATPIGFLVLLLGGWAIEMEPDRRFVILIWYAFFAAFGVSGLMSGQIKINNDVRPKMDDLRTYPPATIMWWAASWAAVLFILYRIVS
jgi:hypothetical protein